MKISLIFSLLTLCAIGNLFSQKKPELEKHFTSNISTSQKIEILLDSSKNNFQTNSTKAIFFGKAALQYAKEDNSIQNIAKAHQYIGEAYYRSEKKDSALIEYNKSLEYSQKQNDHKTTGIKIQH